MSQIRSTADEIASLKAEIEGYRSEYASATSEERKDMIRALITERSKTLNILLAQQGEPILPRIYFASLHSYNVVFHSHLVCRLSVCIIFISLQHYFIAVLIICM